MAWDWFNGVPADVGWDLQVRIPDEPGGLAAIGTTLADADVVVQGGIGVAGDHGSGRVHLLVDADDRDRARTALEAAGKQVEREREVLVATVVGEPGHLIGWAISRQLAEAGINVDLFYVATRTRLVYGVDDLERARRAVAD